MSDETDLIKLYSARILALTAEIPHLGRMEAPQASVKRRSPLCGSTVTVDVRVEEGCLAEMKQDVKACAHRPQYSTKKTPHILRRMAASVGVPHVGTRFARGRRGQASRCIKLGRMQQTKRHESLWQNSDKGGQM